MKFEKRAFSSGVVLALVLSLWNELDDIGVVRVEAFSLPFLSKTEVGSLSSSASAPSSSPIVRIEVAGVPQDLNSIRECRSTVDFASDGRDGPKVGTGSARPLLASHRAFIDATSAATRDDVTCVVAREASVGGIFGGLMPGGRIVGTADCQISTSTGILDPTREEVMVYVQNVYVRPDRRGQGLGRRLMLEGVEGLVAKQQRADKQCLSAAPDAVADTKISLKVDTQNKPAVELYRKCGYEPWGPLNAAVLGFSELTGLTLQVAMVKRLQGDSSCTRAAAPTWRAAVMDELPARWHPGIISSGG